MSRFFVLVPLSFLPCLPFEVPSGGLLGLARGVVRQPAKRKLFSFTLGTGTPETSRPALRCRGPWHLAVCHVSCGGCRTTRHRGAPGVRSGDNRVRQVRCQAGCEGHEPSSCAVSDTVGGQLMCRARLAQQAKTALTDAIHREVCTWRPTQRRAQGANWSGTERTQDTYANYTGQGYPHTTKTTATTATKAKVQNEQTKSPGKIKENSNARNRSSQGAQEADPSSPRARHFMGQSHCTTHKTTYTIQQYTERKKIRRYKKQRRDRRHPQACSQPQTLSPPYTPRPPSPSPTAHYWKKPMPPQSGHGRPIVPFCSHGTHGTEAPR